jgi:hypothetical protein
MKGQDEVHVDLIPDCRLSLRKGNADFAEQKATLQRHCRSIADIERVPRLSNPNTNIKFKIPSSRLTIKNGSAGVVSLKPFR